MASSSNETEQFGMLGRAHYPSVYEDFEEFHSGQVSNTSISLIGTIRHHHPGMTVTVVQQYNTDLLKYAATGAATIELDTSNNAVVKSRSYTRPVLKGEQGSLDDKIAFACYNYTWKDLKFILYISFSTTQFILYPPAGDENIYSNSKAVDELLMAVGQAAYPADDAFLVFDGSWCKSTSLYREVQKTSWEDVILESGMKQTLMSTIEEFFDREQTYKDFGVPWKRGLIFHGPPGNGKTYSIRALMHSLSKRENVINMLYVKSAGDSGAISTIFDLARQRSPCLLILEDIDSLVPRHCQSYFFNEVDGLENNDGIMIIATTNHLERLDGGIANRPSRFDRKYCFSNPSMSERKLFCNSWRQKLADKPIKFPVSLSTGISEQTEGLSFAYLKEAFLAALLAVARGTASGIYKPTGISNASQTTFEDVPLWIEIKEEIRILREDSITKQAIENDENVSKQFRGSSGHPYDILPPMPIHHRGGNITINDEYDPISVAISHHVYGTDDDFDGHRHGRY